MPILICIWVPKVADGPGRRSDGGRGVSEAAEAEPQFFRQTDRSEKGAQDAHPAACRCAGA